MDPSIADTKAFKMANEQAQFAFHYFRAVQGKAVPRYGSGSFIGATRGKKGFTINPKVVVAIPRKEFLPYQKAYRSALRHKSLAKATDAEYSAYLEGRKKANADVKANAQSETGGLVA